MKLSLLMLLAIPLAAQTQPDMFLPHAPIVLAAKPVHRFWDAQGIALQGLAVGAQVFDAMETRRALQIPRAVEKYSPPPVKPDRGEARGNWH